MRKPKLSKLDKFEAFVKFSKQRSVRILIGVGLLYLVLVTLEIPFVFSTGFGAVSLEPLTRSSRLASEVDFEQKEAPIRPQIWVSENSEAPSPSKLFESKNQSKIISDLRFDAKTFDPYGSVVELHKSAKSAWEVGQKLRAG